MQYIKPLNFVKRALTNGEYYKSYAAYGGGAFLLAIYYAEWQTVGQYIPVWNRRYPKEE